MSKSKSNTGKDGWADVMQGGRPPFIAWKKKGQTVEGIVGDHWTYSYKKKDHTAMAVTDTQTGEVVGLTDNYALAPLIALAKKGDSVRIVFGARKNIGKGKNKQTLLEFAKVQHKPA